MIFTVVILFGLPTTRYCRTCNEMEPSAEPCAVVFHFTTTVLAWILCTFTDKGAAGTSDWKKKSNNEMCKICTSYYMIWRIMIWYDKIWYDMIYDIWYMIIIWYMVYDTELEITSWKLQASGFYSRIFGIRRYQVSDTTIFPCLPYTYRDVSF